MLMQVQQIWIVSSTPAASILRECTFVAYAITAIYTNLMLKLTLSQIMLTNLQKKSIVNIVNMLVQAGVP